MYTNTAITRRTLLSVRPRRRAVRAERSAAAYLRPCRCAAPRCIHKRAQAMHEVETARSSSVDSQSAPFCVRCRPTVPSQEFSICNALGYQSAGRRVDRALYPGGRGQAGRPAVCQETLTVIVLLSSPPETTHWRTTSQADNAASRQPAVLLVSWSARARSCHDRTSHWFARTEALSSGMAPSKSPRSNNARPSCSKSRCGVAHTYATSSTSHARVAPHVFGDACIAIGSGQ